MKNTEMRQFREWNYCEMKTEHADKHRNKKRQAAHRMVKDLSEDVTFQLQASWCWGPAVDGQALPRASALHVSGPG